MLQSATIPVIELNESYYSDLESFSKELGKGFEEYGFVALKGHNISPLLFEDMYKCLENFFSQDENEKKLFEKPEYGHQRGYLPLDGEKHTNSVIQDIKECYHIGQLNTNNIYPNERFKSRSESLFCELESLGLIILKALDLYLESNGYLCSLIFDEKVGNHFYGNHLLRLISYPKIDNPVFNEDGLIIRGASHVDLNLITLLPVATKTGLQIYGKDKKWHTVHVPEDTVIVNVASMLEFITAGTDKEMKATVHRIVADEDLAKEPRFSCPFFLHPNHNLPLINLRTNQVVVYDGIELDQAGKYVHRRLEYILPKGSVPPYDEWKENQKSI